MSEQGQENAASSEPSAPTRYVGPYGAIGPGAKVNPWWAALLVSLGVLVVSIVASLFGAIIGVVVAAAAGVDFADESALITYGVIGAMVVQFPAMAAASLIWGGVIEKRSLASMGFTGGGLGKYLVGLVGGVAIAGALIFLTQFVGPALGFASSEFAEGEPVWARLQTAQVYWILGLLVGFFLIQGASEEILFRGWLQSSLFARVGALPAVVLNSIVFGLMHFHFWMLEGPVVGTFAVATVGMIGVVFSFWALRERSIWGVCGAHGTYNATLVGTAIAVLIASSEEGPMAALEELLALFTETDGVPQTPFSEAALQFGLVSVIAIAAMLIWARRPRRATDSAS